MKNKKYKINNQNVIKWANTYDGPKFHALLCDAPYHLTTITKRFGKDDSVPAQFGKDGAFQRVGKGFMGQEWDGNMISFQPETWAALGEHLYPGAFGMTFGGSRTAHRIAVAIEDAGFIIHPMIVWVYGSGFPKATRIDTQIDKGKERKVIGKKKLWGHNAGSGAGSYSKNSYEGQTGITRYEDITEPATELSKAWQGHRYGMQALKPAAEPIIVFQKPYDDKPVANMVRTGAGALNIDAGRIPSEPYTINTWDDNAHPFGGGAGNKFTGRQVSGRWPANFILDDSMASALDAQSGHLKSGKNAVRTKPTKTTAAFHKDLNVLNRVEPFYEDEGGASRYFYNVQTQLDEADPFLYVKKASGKERNAGLEMEPITIRRTHGEMKADTSGKNHNTTGQIPAITHNPHPTVKPIDLTRHLASLLLPPDAYAPRRIMVPFSGVASEMIGALLAGWDYVEGIELGKEYCKIGEMRLRHWLK